MTPEEPAQPRLHERLLAEQNERRRLGELLHDGAIQHLAALKQMLDAALHAAEAGDMEATATIVRRALEVAGDATADLRELVRSIEPAELQESGLRPAILALTSGRSRLRDSSVDVSVQAEDRLGPAALVGLYQIVRECLDQAVRRGPPNNVSIVLAVEVDQSVTLTIGDDAAPERRQAVLEGLAERAHDLGGTLELRNPKSGTSMTVRLPPSAAVR